MTSLVSTVYNDFNGVRKFFCAMERQSLLPNEIVIVDAGSKDGTWELLNEEQNRSDRPWNIVAICEPKCNVARGRNLAIEAARGDIIVSTDIGCDWDEQWLEELMRPLEINPGIDLVIGSWAVNKDDLHGEWALVEWAIKGGQKLEATAESYSSSRSIAYRKTCWQALGRYPEDLTFAGDDALFHFLIEKAEVTRAGAPKVRCYWHRHSTLSGFLKEAYRYGIGSGEAGIFMRDFALTGCRMMLEIGMLMSGILLIILPLNGSVMAGGGLLIGGLGLFVLRIFGLRNAVERMKAHSSGSCLYRILKFIYLTKIWWLCGMAKGWFRGASLCRDSRKRLKEMTAEKYRYAMLSQLRKS